MLYIVRLIKQRRANGDGSKWTFKGWFAETWKVSKAREKESSALSKLSSDKVANELETQLGLPSETIISQKKLESQVQELTQITIDAARNFPRDTALLVYAYDKFGKNALANTLINTINKADKKVMQSVQREFANLIQQESE